MICLLMMIATVSSSTVFGQVPESIPFRRNAVPWVLPRAHKIKVKVYVAGSHFPKKRMTLSALPVLKNKHQLKRFLNKITIDYEFAEPSDSISVYYDVCDSKGKPVLTVFQIFSLVLKKNELVPSHSRFYFQLHTQSVMIKGAQSAKVIDRNGVEIGLDVVDGVIEIPSWASCNSYLDLFKINFKDGTVVGYSSSGKLIH